jgi:hypothetical protein
MNDTECGFIGYPVFLSRERSLRFHFLAGFAVVTVLLITQAAALW